MSTENIDNWSCERMQDELKRRNIDYNGLNKDQLRDKIRSIGDFQCKGGQQQQCKTECCNFDNWSTDRMKDELKGRNIDINGLNNKDQLIDKLRSIPDFQGKQHLGLHQGKGQDIGGQQGQDFGRQQGQDMGRQQGQDFGRQQGQDIGRQQDVPWQQQGGVQGQEGGLGGPVQGMRLGQEQGLNVGKGQDFGQGGQERGLNVGKGQDFGQGGQERGLNVGKGQEGQGGQDKVPTKRYNVVKNPPKDQQQFDQPPTEPGMGDHPKNWSTSQIKDILDKHNVDRSKCVEKEELLNLLQSLPEYKKFPTYQHPDSHNFDQYHT